MSISSFEGCQVIARNQGNHYVSWCRKVSGTTRAQCCNFDLRLVIDFTLETRGTIRCCKPSKLSLTTLKSVRYLGIEINQDAEAKTTEEDLPAKPKLVGTTQTERSYMYHMYRHSFTKPIVVGTVQTESTIGPTRLSLWIVSLFKMKRNKTK